MKAANETATAILAICEAVIDSIKVAGALGAPAGVLYSALMAHGCTLNQFQPTRRKDCTARIIEAERDEVSA